MALRRRMNRQPLSVRSSLGVITTVLAISACVERETRPARYQPIRLVELLETATVTSPLHGVVAAPGVSDLPDEVAYEEVWRASAENLTIPENCAFETHPELDQQALRCSEESALEPLIEVEGQTYYRVRLRWMRTSSGCLTSSVSERSEDQELRIHKTDKPPPATGAARDPSSWTTAESVFQTTAFTRELEVSLLMCEQWLRELTVDRLALTAEQELALLKAKDLANRADPGLGMWKRGRALPLPDPTTVEPPLEANYVIRNALFTPAPTDVTFELMLPREARLRFHYAMAGESQVGDRVQFRLLAQSQAGPERELWSSALAIESLDESWHWYREDIDLADFSNQNVRLTLQTRSSTPRAYALWGDPVIDVSTQEQASPTNVVLIAVDTLRADRLSAYGYPVATSQNLEALAADGVRFDQAAAPFGNTRPSFASLFTGSGPFDTESFVPLERPTLASRFQAAGWATAAIVYKAYLFSGGYDQGFDHYFNVPIAEVLAHKNVDRAIEWLDENDDRRFFLFLHLNDPHQPFCQPRESVPNHLHERLADLGLAMPIGVMSHRVSGRKAETPTKKWIRLCETCVDGGADQETFRAISRDLYDDAVQYADQEIGRFLQELKTRDLYDDTLIAFVADHGEGLWRNDEYGHADASLYDDLTRVPLIIKPPAGREWARNRVVESQVRHYDLMPTLLEMAGIDADDSWIDGESLVPSLKAEAKDGIEERVAVMISRRHQMAAARHSGWKYIERFEDPIRKELYRVDQDVNELHDLIEEQPILAAQLRHQIFEELLAASSNQVLLVTGAPPDGPYEIRVTWDHPDVSLLPISLPQQPNNAQKDPSSPDAVSRFTLKGRSEERLLLLARFRAPPDSSARVEITFPGQAPERLAVDLPATVSRFYERGELADLLERSETTFSRFHGPEVRVEEHTEGTVDARQIEALRALGYLD